MTTPRITPQRTKAPDLRWKAQAACRGVGPSIFFADPSETAKHAEAAAYCSRCPVTAACAAYGAREPEGRWGGVLVGPMRRRRAS